ncbi:MAG: addiction module protein [Verrucomicrobiales bacterium]|nr:addiction module protein [Verrucomicrobiales bacterium]
MSNEQLLEAALAMPLTERVSLAQELWDSITKDEPTSPSEDPQEVIAMAQRRDAELAAGAVVPCTHEQVMSEARRAIQCA